LNEIELDNEISKDSLNEFIIMSDEDFTTNCKYFINEVIQTNSNGKTFQVINQVIVPLIEEFIHKNLKDREERFNEIYKLIESRYLKQGSSRSNSILQASNKKINRKSVYR
jgi:hypothetical protein